MTIAHSLRIRNRIAFFAAIGATVFLLVACQPIQDPALLEAVQTAPDAANAETTQDTTDDVPDVGVEPAQATVNTSSLRVREAPFEDSEMIAGIKQGETYPVLSISSDGEWIQLEGIPQASDGIGWVSSEFVTLEGDITNIATVEVATDASAPQDTTPSEDIGDTEEAVAEEEAMESEDSATEASEVETPVEPPAAGFAAINTTTPLRVRSAPTTEEDNKIGNVFHGEIYEVLEISEDGQWVRIDVPELDPENGGWVSAEFVVLGE